MPLVPVENTFVATDMIGSTTNRPRSDAVPSADAASHRPASVCSCDAAATHAFSVAEPTASTSTAAGPRRWPEPASRRRPTPTVRETGGPRDDVDTNDALTGTEWDPKNLDGAHQLTRAAGVRVDEGKSGHI